jgi:Family of unknown function (DUF5631)/Family of unknown function (DUF5632)
VLAAQFTAAHVTGGCRYACPVAIFGRISARQRLRRAAQESLTIPAFSSPIDCTPWVIGGLWPAELSTITAENATVADHLRDDLQRIARTANDQLKLMRRAGMADPVRQAQEARVIEQARAHAVRRVESVLRRLQPMTARPPARHARPPAARDSAAIDMDKTQVIPAVRDSAPASAAPANTVSPDVVRVDGQRPDTTAIETAIETPATPGSESLAVAAALQPEPPLQAPATTVPNETDSERLQRLLAFVVRQEPTLNWAVGDCADGTTVLVTDLAHGWIPARISIPEEVRLLTPERRTGKASTMVGDTLRQVTYAPGDSLDWSAEFGETPTSVQPRELPAVEDLGWDLSQATHWRDGVPRMVHTLARAAAAGTGVVDDEVDLLRVHLDTAHQQVLSQYPDVEPAHLQNCLLLAATEGFVTGDRISANYHLSWFQKLNAPPVSRWETTL